MNKEAVQFFVERMNAIGAPELAVLGEKILRRRKWTGWFWSLLKKMRKNKRPVIAVISRSSNPTVVGEVEGEYAGSTYNVLDSILQVGGIPLTVPVTDNSAKDRSSIPVLFQEGRFNGLFMPGTQVNDLAPGSYRQESTYSENTQLDHDRYEMALILWAIFILKIPVLGVCLGHQRLGCALGADFWQDLVKERGPVRPTENHSRWDLGRHMVVLRGLLREILNKDWVETNTLHHQAIKEDNLPSWLEVIAYAPDGVIEAITLSSEWLRRMKHLPRFVVGVQWHPELQGAEQTHPLFKAFVDETRR